VANSIIWVWTVPPAKSTAGDGLRNRVSKLYEDYYFDLISHFSGILSDSRHKKGVKV
jgi:hypothetical protein